MITCWRASATHHRVKPTLVVRSLLCEARQHVIKGAAACSPSSSPSSSRSKLSQSEQIWTFPQFFQTHSENRFRNSSNPDETLERRAPLRAVHVRHSGEQPSAGKEQQGKQKSSPLARAPQCAKRCRCAAWLPAQQGASRWLLYAAARWRQTLGAGGDAPARWRGRRRRHSPRGAEHHSTLTPSVIAAPQQAWRRCSRASSL